MADRNQDLREIFQEWGVEEELKATDQIGVSVFYFPTTMPEEELRRMLDAAIKADEPCYDSYINLPTDETGHELTLEQVNSIIEGARPYWKESKKDKMLAIPRKLYYHLARIFHLFRPNK